MENFANNFILLNSSTITKIHDDKTVSDIVKLIGYTEHRDIVNITIRDEHGPSFDFLEIVLEINNSYIEIATWNKSGTENTFTDDVTFVETLKIIRKYFPRTKPFNPLMSKIVFV